MLTKRAAPGSKSVGLKPMPGKRNSAGVAYIYLPIDSDRNEYIENCIRTGQVTIITENNEEISKVPIGKLAIQLIEFPQSRRELGSPVLWVNIPKHNQMIITDVLNFSDEMQDIKPNQFKIKKQSTSGESSAEISVKGDKGELFINVESDLEEGGTINLNLTNKTKTAKLKVQVQGEIDIYTEGSTTITNSKSITFEVKDPSVDKKITSLSYTKGDGLNYIDEFNNSITAKENEIIVKNDKGTFSITNSGITLENTTGEKIIMKSDGITIKNNLFSFGTLLDNLITEVESLQVIVNGIPGVVSPPTIVKIKAIQEQFKLLIKA